MACRQCLLQWLSIDGNRHHLREQVCTSLCKAGNRSKFRLQRCCVTSRCDRDHIVGQVLRKCVVNFHLQVLPKRQHQSDCEDADEQSQNRRRRACTLSSDIAQGHLRVDLPRTRQKHDDDSRQRNRAQDDPEHRQHQVHQG